MRLRFPLFLDQEATPGGGTAAAAPARPATPPANPQQRASSLADRLIARHGTAEAALAFLATQNIQHEDTIDTLTRENTDLKGRAPKDGQMVLDKDAAKSWAKLQALNLTPDQIVAAVESEKALKAKDSERTAKDAYRQAAAPGGLDADAFVEHAWRNELTVEMRDVDTTEHGKPVKKKLPFIKAKGDKATFVSATDYLNSLPAHEQRALRPGTAAASTVSSTGSGVPYVAQSPAPAASGTTGDAVKDFARRRNEADRAKTTPTRPATAAAS